MVIVNDCDDDGSDEDEEEKEEADEAADERLEGWKAFSSLCWGTAVAAETLCSWSGATSSAMMM